MELKKDQKEELYWQGFTILPGIVPGELVDRTLATVNYSLGSQGIPPEEIAGYNSRSFCPELTNNATILDLVNQTPLRSLAESAIGPGKLNEQKGCQIALRFPRPYTPQAASGPHMDGMHAPLNGVPSGQILSFTALLGIFLSDTPHDDMGNLKVWPGSHRQYEAYFREYGPEKLLEGMPPVELAAPMQVKAKAGDAILCHYQIGHTVAPNFSPHVRYAIYFRLMAKGHKELGLHALSDIWQEWDGMQEIVKQPVAHK